MTVWGQQISRRLHRFRFGSPYFRGKGRLFHWLRTLTGRPRLTLPYGRDGWITVDDEGENIERYVWYHGVHEAEVWEALAAQITPEAVFWDIGANIGTVAIQALRDPRIRAVHCFEPNPKAAAILDINLRLNGAHYVIHPLALGAAVGTASFHLGPDQQSDISSLNVEHHAGNVHVQLETIDHLIASGVTPPTLLKIDVEGWEEPVLRGAAALLDATPPHAIVFEAACDPQGVILNTALTTLLENAGYTITHIRRASGKLHYFEGQYLENYLAARPPVR
ncbi:MAG: FkbM family methyltransferase [Chloroflexi bacterium]|nr:FkbM family methyltransferase [Chloroflexota bacterium]